MTKTTEEHWIESRWIVPKTEVDVLQTKFEQLGALGCYENLDLDEAIEAQKSKTELMVYFPDKESVNEFAEQLKQYEDDSAELVILKRIPQGNWATAWKQYFKPFFLTDNVVIKPSWEEYEPKGEETVIVLDPGMAFGTGQHDTTKFCSEYVCELQQEHPELKSMLDIGCGSGILSIIAKKMGFEDITGVDIDPAAIETAFENLDRNPETKPIHFFQNKGDIKHKDLKQSDVVVSNIIAEILCDLKDDLVSLVKPGGYLVLSGIMSEREDLIKDHFKELELISEKKSDHWHAYLYRKN